MVATVMAMRSLRSVVNSMELEALGVLVSGQRAFSAKAKKGGKGGAADAPKVSILDKEVKSTTVVGANILKDGTDPKILPDSEYPKWLWHLVDKRPALSELRRKNILLKLSRMKISSALLSWPITE